MHKCAWIHSACRLPVNLIAAEDFDHALAFVLVSEGCKVILPYRLLNEEVSIIFTGGYLFIGMKHLSLLQLGLVQIRVAFDCSSDLL